MATWWFVRHGQSVANAEGWLSGHVDVPLTEVGQAQAVAAGEVLADEPLERCWCSDLQRARQTAALLIGDRDLPVQITPALRERNLGIYERQQRDELRKQGRFEDLLTWDHRPEGGESYVDLARRTLPFLATIDSDAPTLIVAHGGTIRTLIGLLDEVDVHTLSRTWVPNCEPIARQVLPEQWRALNRRLAP